MEIRLGAGAFVCGEETALIASIEGKRGTPKPRPPYPAVSGLWGKPTLINNVETFANIAPIIRKGGKWFASMGSERSKGTKVFALTGKITNTGLVEVPMGIKLREIIEGIGGGVPDGHTFKAVQTGGPSGGCIPAEMLDIGVSYDALIAVGSIMGSGGMIVMDDTSCMVNVARFFIEFCMTESCGKCIPCRAGTAQMYTLLTRICEGTGTMDDLELLVDLCATVKETSLCGLGQTAPNPVLSTLHYFRNEYIEHIVHKRCPAGVCNIAGATSLLKLPWRCWHERQPLTSKHSSSTDRKSARAPARPSLKWRARTTSTFPRSAIWMASAMWAPAACAWSRSRAATSCLPACVTTVFEGMEVSTDTERLQKHRRTILELLFAERNHICSVCVSNGHCELQTLGAGAGPDARAPALSQSRTCRSTHRTSASPSTTTAASCARAACASAPRLKARTSGT